ncbi:MAG: polymorphic toxin-type HINT domain-containing protein [Ruminococcus sp.]
MVTTVEHPFYVKSRGFIEAGNLLVGDKFVSAIGEDLLIEDYYIELTEELVLVYNFQVEDFHTYFVGDCVVWVHNAECTKAQVVAENQKNGKKAQEARHNELLETHPETQSEITIRPFDDNGNLVDYNVRVDELTNEFFNEVKATETAPYTKNQLKGYELL